MPKFRYHISFLEISYITFTLRTLYLHASLVLPLLIITLQVSLTIIFFIMFVTPLSHHMFLFSIRPKSPRDFLAPKWTTSDIFKPRKQLTIVL